MIGEEGCWKARVGSKSKGNEAKVLLPQSVRSGRRVGITRQTFCCSMWVYNVQVQYTKNVQSCVQYTASLLFGTRRNESLPIYYSSIRSEMHNRCTEGSIAPLLPAEHTYTSQCPAPPPTPLRYHWSPPPKLDHNRIRSSSSRPLAPPPMHVLNKRAHSVPPGGSRRNHTYPGCIYASQGSAA